MSQQRVYLPGERARARWMRLDTAQILKRFFFCERSLLIGMAARLPAIASLDIKIELPHFIWQTRRRPMRCGRGFLNCAIPAA